MKHNKHFDDLCEFTLATPFTIIGISGMWLEDFSQDLYSIPGYSFLSRGRFRGGPGGSGPPWKIKFTSKAQYLLTPLVTPAYVLKMQGMAVLEGPDFKISWGSMSPDPLGARACRCSAPSLLISQIRPCSHATVGIKLVVVLLISIKVKP